MTAPAWHATAARIPLWPGALTRGGWRVVSVDLDLLTLRCDGYHDTHATQAEWGAGPDLEDPDTFRGAVARLAEAMGAPPEDVAIGVTFSAMASWVGGPPDRTPWILSAGTGHGHGRGWLRRIYIPDEEATGRPSALAAAWAQHLDGRASSATR